MSDLNVALGQSGAKHTITVDDVTYPVSYVDQKAKTAWAKWLFSKEREAEEMGKANYTEEEYQKRLEKLNKRYLMGEFELIEELSMTVIKTRTGMLKLCSILFGVDEMTMLNLMIAKGQEITSLVQLILKESLRQPKEGKPGGSDPNA